MGGVRRPDTTLAFAYLQAVLLYDVIETAVADAVFRAELPVVHLPQLATAYATVLTADTPYVLHAESLFGKPAHVTVTMLVVGLRRYTKQPALRPVNSFSSGLKMGSISSA